MWYVWCQWWDSWMGVIKNNHWGYYQDSCMISTVFFPKDFVKSLNFLRNICFQSSDSYWSSIVFWTSDFKSYWFRKMGVSQILCLDTDSLLQNGFGISLMPYSWCLKCFLAWVYSCWKGELDSICHKLLRNVLHSCMCCCPSFNSTLICGNGLVYLSTENSFLRMRLPST